MEDPRCRARGLDHGLLVDLLLAAAFVALGVGRALQILLTCYPA